MLSLGLTLAFLEGACRVGAWTQNRRSFERAMARARPPAPGSRVPLGGLFRPSREPRIVYELWPRMDVVFDESLGGPGTRIRTNADGFRDRDYPFAKGSATLRIVGIGDSLMFGWGVEQGGDYLSVLERMLNARPSGSAWEVINTAVPGYNTAMEVATLREKALRYRPDLVVLGFCPNDASLPNFIRAERDVLAPGESFLFGFVRDRLHPPAPAESLVSAPRRADNRAFQDDPSRVPRAYRGITGWEAFTRALLEVRDLGRVHGFRTVVLAFVPDHDDERKELGLRRVAEVGFPILDVGEVQAAYLRARGLSDYPASGLTVSDRDLHPSALSHELAAAELLAWMSAEGLYRLK